MAAALAQLPATPAGQDCVACSLRQFVFELLERVDELEKRNAELEKRNAELEARLAKYENAHTPPSLREKKPAKSRPNSSGRPEGYEGSTRPTPEPERIVGVTAQECPRCRSPLGEPVRIESRIIEDTQDYRHPEEREGHHNP